VFRIGKLRGRSPRRPSAMQSLFPFRHGEWASRPPPPDVPWVSSGSPKPFDFEHTRRPGGLVALIEEGRRFFGAWLYEDRAGYISRAEWTHARLGLSGFMKEGIPTRRDLPFCSYCLLLLRDVEDLRLYDLSFRERPNGL